jgi:hypothetical protein
VSEGNSGITFADFTVSLTSASSQTVSVGYGTEDGTATALGSDYSPISGTLTFAPGQTSKTISVGVYGDTTYEPDEIFYLDLAGATNASISDAQGKGTIVNDDSSGGCVTPISLGAAIVGTLANTDCVGQRGAGYFTDRYSFTGTAGHQVAVLLTSSAYDTYLYLTSPTGTVWSNDDDAGNTNSFLELVLPQTGSYTIDATSYYTGSTGAYNLRLVQPAATDIWTDRSTYHVGDTATICYDVPEPSYIELHNLVAGGGYYPPVPTFYSVYDDGTGDCIAPTATYTEVTGLEIDAYVDSTLVGRATTPVTILP